MPFKYELRQRVCLPGQPGIAAVVFGRGEAVDQEPLYRLRWLDADGPHEAAHVQRAIELANAIDVIVATPEIEPRVTVAAPGASLVPLLRRTSAMAR